MADTTVQIGANLSVNTGNSAASVDQVTNSMKQGSSAAKGVAAANRDVEDSFSGLKSKLTSVPGAVKSAEEGVQGLSTAFKALLANPVVLVITLIVAALAALYKAFTSTFEGGEKVEQVFAGIKAAIQVVVDRAIQLGNAIIKFFSGDFKGAITDAKAAVSGVADAMGAAYDQASRLQEEAQKLHREQLANDLDQAQRQKQLAVLREQALDDSVPAAKRIASLKQLQADAQQNAKDDIDLARRTTANKIAQLSMGLDAEKKNQDEINKLKIDQINVETENANELRRIDKALHTALKQSAADAAADQKKRDDEAKAAKEQLLEFNNKYTKLQQDNDLAIIQDSYKKEVQALAFKTADEKAANDQAVIDKKLSRQQADQLNAQLDKAQQLQADNLQKAHDKDIAQATADFEKQLNDLRTATRTKGNQDERSRAMAQLQTDYEARIEQVLSNEKLTQEQREQLIIAYGEQLQADVTAQQIKFDQETTSKRLKAQEGQLKAEHDAKLRNHQLSYQDDVDFFNKTRDLERQDLVNKKASSDQLLAFDEATTAGRIDLSNKEKDAKLNNYTTVGNALQSLGALAGEQTTIGKGLAVAQAIINTYTGATKALAQGGIFGFIGAAAVIASGLASVQKILSVDTSGASTSTSGAGAAAGVSVTTAPVQPQAQSTTIDQDSVNAVGDATSGRAYVVASDITNSQERAATLNRAARLG